MRRTAAILMLGLFFSCGFIKAPQRADVHTEPLPPDSLRSLYLYTDLVSSATASTTTRSGPGGCSWQP